MSPAPSNQVGARLESLAQIDRVREDRALNEGQTDRRAALYKGRTVFAHAHRAHAKLLANKLRANTVRARLAQARKTRAAKRGKFEAQRKPSAPVLKHGGAQASGLRSHLHRHNGMRVTRDGGRGGQGGQGNQDGQQEPGQERRDGREKQQRREFIKRSSAARASNASWLGAAFDRQEASTHAPTDACCDALLDLREQLATNPHARIDQPVLRIAREIVTARLSAAAPEATQLAAVLARLGTRAALRSNALAPHAPGSSRLAHFNLLLGLHVLMMQRPLRQSSACRTSSTLAALEARAA